MKILVKMVGLNISGTMKQYMDVLSNPSEAVLEYGMFDGVRVDGGKEFFLVFGMQVELQDLRDRCVPNQIRIASSRINPIAPNEAPDEAVELYEQVYNGQVTQKSTFGEHPLEQHEDLKVQRKIRFDTNFDVSMLYSTAVNDNTALFQRTISSFIRYTEELTAAIQ